MRYWPALVTGLWLLGQSPVAFSDPALTIELSRGTPRVCLVPCDVRIVVKVARNPANRVLWLVWGTNEVNQNTHRETMDGEAEPVTHTFDKSLREAGTWVFVAKVERAAPAKAETAHVSVEVLGGY